MATIGYARVSTREQNPQSQVAELEAAGVRAGTVRLSVGIEDLDDLIWDLEQGFARVRAMTGREAAPTKGGKS